MGLEQVQSALEDPERQTASSLFVTVRKDEGCKWKREAEEEGESKRIRHLYST